ncbi:MAG: acylphosphatase [Nitriliruptor sp.]
MRAEPRPGEEVVARAVSVTGRVQGVSFRWSLRRVAGRHGVKGWVRNRDDGGLDAHLEGDADAVETVEAWIHAGGPPSAEIAEVEVESVDPIGAEGFTILR